MPAWTIPYSRSGVFPMPAYTKIRVGFLPEEMTFFRTGGRKWKKLISSISSAEDLEESGRFGRKWNKWNITNIKNKIHVL